MNNPPVAELSHTSMVIKEDEEITLNAEKSEDIEDSESDFEFYWELSDDEGPFIVTFNETFTFTIHQRGEYQVKLRVKDTDGATDWDELDLTVENVKPTAKIEVTKRNPQVDEIILFNAAGSSDTTSDIETLTFTWNFGDDSHEMGKTINHSYSQPQRFTVTLTVTDDDGESHQATMSIIVEPKGKDDGTSETDDDFQGLYLMAGVAVIIVIILVLLFVLILKKKRKFEDDEELPEMTTLEPLPPVHDQASEQSVEQPLKQPYTLEEPTGKPPTLAEPELGTIPSPEAFAQEPSTTELPSTDEQILGTTETTTLPAQEMPTIEASQTPKLPPRTEELPDSEKDTQTPGPTETESETEQNEKEVLLQQKPEEPSIDQENGSDSNVEQPEDKTENEEH
jgi:PKD repeat protein